MSDDPATGRRGPTARILARFTGGRRRPTTVRQSLASIVLGFELFVVFLASLVTFGLKAVDPVLALVGGGLLCVVTIIAIATLRTRVGYVLGWFVQLVMVAAGILVPIMFLIGAFFAGIWAYCMVTGARIDAQKRAYLRQNPGLVGDTPES